MNQFLQLNYDELRLIVKRSKNDGEDIISLLSRTRQKVHDLKTEWIGEGAEKFFDEMETQLLPALQRTGEALFFTEETLVKIIRTINEADKETASYFKHDMFEFNKPGLGHFSGIVENLSEGQSMPGNLGLNNDLQSNLGQIGGSAGLGATGLGQDVTGAEPHTPQEGASSTGAQGSGGGTGSSGGIGSSSSGGTGDLNSMGSGVGAQTSSGLPGEVGGASSAGAQGMSDHLYDGLSGTGEVGGETNNAGNSAGSVGQTSDGGTEALAAGAAVIGSAGLGSAAKAVRGRKK